MAAALPLSSMPHEFITGENNSGRPQAARLVQAKS
jgi:hypothetical protein